LLTTLSAIGCGKLRLKYDSDAPAARSHPSRINRAKKSLPAQQPIDELGLSGLSKLNHGCPKL
ncbi:MAG: hypothetical protein AAFV72_26340, partial [Cyanobacteria bacterium J06635_1]